MGILQPVLDAEAARGNSASVDVERRLVRGDPPQAQLARPIDRAAVSAQFDLGPLVAWWPRAWGVFDLVDIVTGTTIRSGEPSPVSWWRRRSSAPAASGPGERLGWLADDPRIGLSATGVVTTYERRARVHVSGSATEALAGIAEVIAATDAGTELPVWFAARLAPERDDEDWKAYFRERDRLEQAEWKVSGWSTRWTERGWRRAMAPGERTWRWVGAEVAHDHAFDATVEVVDGAPIGSLKWLLHTVGALRCGPAGSDA